MSRIASACSAGTIILMVRAISILSGQHRASQHGQATTTSPNAMSRAARRS
jgi:hypothetical protein